MQKAFDSLESYNLDAKHQDLANSYVNYPDKDRGHIALQPTDFSFIGPDAIDTYNLDLYLKIAGNVNQVCLNINWSEYPLNLGLNTAMAASINQSISCPSALSPYQLILRHIIQFVGINHQNVRHIPSRTKGGNLVFGS